MRVSAEGYPFVIGLALAGFAMFFMHHPLGDALGWLFIAGSAFCIFFFRDPLRFPDQDPRFVLSPGDGKVMEVVLEDHPYFGGNARVIRIFLSIFDVHVQHSPIAGRVSRVVYQRGKFLDARDPKAAHENENNSIFIENDRTKAVVKQIAGLIARRIVCKVRVGENLKAGQKLGLIRFGSQVDLYLPMDVEVCVASGDAVASGISVVALNKKAIGNK